MRGSITLTLLSLYAILSGCEKAPPTPPPPPPPPTEEAIAAFFTAADQGDALAIRTALDNGMPVNYVDEENNSALLYAAFNGHVETMRVLILAGADVNYHGKIGSTALMMACGPRPKGFPDAVKLLLDHHAEINAIDSNEHFTALMYAASDGLSLIVDILLEAGADPTMVDIDNDTAAVFARNNGFVGIANKLQALIDAQTFKKK